MYFDEKQTVHGLHWSTDHILNTSIEETWGRLFPPGQILTYEKLGSHSDTSLSGPFAHFC